MSNFDATTALNQLTRSNNGINRLCAMTGAHTFINHGDAISFKFKGSRTASFCKIQLNADDTYTMTLGKIRKYELIKVQAAEHICWDALKPAFESRTGLYLSM